MPLSEGSWEAEGMRRKFHPRRLRMWKTEGSSPQLPAEGRRGKGVGTFKEMTFTKGLPVERSFALGYKIVLFQGGDLMARKSVPKSSN